MIGISTRGNWDLLGFKWESERQRIDKIQNDEKMNDAEFQVVWQENRQKMYD